MPRKNKSTTDPTKIFEDLKAELAKDGYELILRKTPTRDIVAFDFGLIFTKDSDVVQIYVDDLLKETIQQLLKTSGQVLLKSNWFSPDTMAVTAAENPDPLKKEIQT
jgi:hypothetical protein